MEAKTCPRCGAAHGADALQGLCPTCLLKQGLQTAIRCGACQMRLPDDARFCAHCGAPAPVPPSEAGDSVRAALEAKLLGQYRIVRLLGRGGMGAVYLARDLTLEREVAIKVVKTEADSREVYDRFRREAKTAARLSHPNIVPLHAFGEVEGMPYFVMGYVRGESLATRLRREGKLSEGEARRVLAEIADALDHAHRQGVVHRDVKPDNVLLEDESGRALLTDFGVAKGLGAGDAQTRAGSVVGTPHYMSPEQAAGRGDVDGRSDIYSLGVMAYAALAGRLPFEGKSHEEVLSRHLTQAPPPLRSLGAVVSDPTLQAVERCLAKDPAQRWPDARSLKLALGAVEDSQLPDALQAVQGQGIGGLAIGAALLLFIGVTRPPWRVLAINVAMLASIYVFVIARLLREGFSLGATHRALWAEPAWWQWWYPRPLRSPRSVWDRLPPAVRDARWWVPVFALYVALFTSGFVFLNVVVYKPRIPGELHLQLFRLVLTGIAVLTVAWLVLLARARGALARLGLGPADANRVILSVPPSRAGFWARPHIAAILAPAPKREASRPESPHDQLQSILRNADELSGPLRPLGAEAAAAARQLIAALEHADREIAELARHLEPGEPERMSDRIRGLEGDEAAPMRRLLEKQLELIRGLEARVEAAKAARSRRVELLKTLALHVASLRTRSSPPPAELGSVSERVRALCDEIGRQSQLLGAAATAPADGTTLERRAE
jgi:serine/threonine-protein kinase